MELIELNVNSRTAVGKGHARTLRRDGKIPATLYGKGSEPVSLSLSTHELETMLKNSASGQQLVNLNLDGSQSKRPAMIKELQREPLSQKILHADFYEVAMDRKIRVAVPVTAVGKSIGVEAGGMLQIIRHNLDVLSLPLAIPDVIEIDVTDLDIGDSVHVEDLPEQEGIEYPHEVNFTILTVLSQKKEALAEEEEEEGEEGAEAAEEAAEEAGGEES